MKWRAPWPVLLLTCGAFAVLGYHPGVEDDTTYLAGVKHALDPSLFPHDLPFVTAQLELSVYDTLVAGFVRTSHLPLGYVLLLWQFAGIFILLWSCAAIAALCFPEASARWTGVAFLAVMLAMPVSGTHLLLVDQHLHPRLLATDCIVLAVLAMLRKRRVLAFPLLAGALALHPLMAAFGISFCCFLAAEARWPGWGSFGRAAAVPLWLWEQPSPDWERATAPRSFLYLYQWPLYSWVTIAGPIALLAVLAARGRRRGENTLALLGFATVRYSLAQLLLAMVLLLPGAPGWLLQLEPMRFLYLTYLFAALLGAGAFGRWWLRASPLRALLVFAPLSCCMVAEQSLEFKGSPHVEWPGARAANPWLDAFAWVRTHTPVDAYFALDPHYTEEPLEGVHSFRALAERSMLADAVKDPGVVTHVPHLAPRWLRETEARAGWQRGNAREFEQLRQQFGIGWILVERPVPGLFCPYNNRVLWVCRLRGK